MTAVAMIGARRGYLVPRALHSLGLLSAFYTDIWAGKPWATAISSIPMAKRISAARHILERKCDHIPSSLVKDFPVWGIMRFVKRTRALTPDERWLFYERENAVFCSLVVKHWPGRRPEAFYAFNAASKEIFRKCKEQDVKCIMDQTAAPWRYDETMLDEERQAWQGWENSASGDSKAWERLAEREEQEWELADKIVCGSEYVVACLRNVRGPVEKCVVIPYPIEQTAKHSRIAAERNLTSRHDELRVLFVGTLCLRKGIQYLAEAAKMMEAERNAGRLKIAAVGPVGVTDKALKEIKKVIEVRPPVDRQTLLGYYRWAHVLVLPTLSEGSANVCYEALATGLPVITTPNAGSIVRDGVEGFIIPTRSAIDLQRAILTMLNNRSLLEQMVANITSRQPENEWLAYCRKLAEAAGIASAQTDVREWLNGHL